MRVEPAEPAAYRLLHEGAITLAQVEAAGMLVDESYLDGALLSTAADLERGRRKLAESKLATKWRERFRVRTNLNSNEQLGKILFEDMGYDCPRLTETGRYSTDEDCLSGVDHSFVRRYLKLKKIEKGRQFLEQIKRQTVGGVVHPSFSLHIPRTYRSSCSDPNFQNVPVRDEWMRKLVRSAVRARPGRRLVEVDYQQIEVRGAYCYHLDPTMRKYLLDPDKDMHRDAAMDVFKLPRGDVGKRIRYAGKNGFVFPEFYGSYWREVSANLWAMVDKLQLVTESGVPLRDHLSQVGLRKLGVPRERGGDPSSRSFAEHVQAIERNFWQRRFPVYDQWRRDWYAKYARRGWLKMLTGFVCRGPMSRNDVINYPVQGSSFHCLLQSLIWLVAELRRRRMRAQVVGQIHDSIVGDVPDGEVLDYVDLCRHIMTERLRDRWRWIKIPILIDTEVTPVGGTWAEKEGWTS